MFIIIAFASVPLLFFLFAIFEAFFKEGWEEKAYSKGFDEGRRYERTQK